MANRTAPMPTRAFADLTAFLIARRRRDLLVPLADAVATIARLALLIEVAQRQADAAEATRLKCEHMRTRAQFEHALHHVIEAIGDELDGVDLVDELMGDGGRTLAQILLDE